MPTPDLPPALLLLGPTASGKTASALALAAHLPIEIISVDSALVFRDMDIGSAKPSAAEQALCPHHLIDILSPEEAYSAAKFRDDALRLMGQITARGRLPVLAGGTMLYFKALRDGLSELPQADAELRAHIDADARQFGWPAMHAALARLDPDAAASLNPNDAQRIQRALEIVRLTGRPLAESYARREMAAPPYRFVGIALAPNDRSVLHQRIEARFDAMLAAGFLDEVRALRAKYALTLDLPSMRCVGYRQAWEHLDGLSDAASFRDKGIAATRQLAKRQLTWQRKFVEDWGDLAVVPCDDDTVVDKTVDTARRLLAGT
ncbi:MAG TPA: tRNA (adenosine(37)-N6)-dimethylallyltransferase MiaA [Ottowia sp.]|nr:tRNA (adenosine(37)-N6)-dimethylallyltransferase MiaA [Ottowia sp.]